MVYVGHDAGVLLVVYRMTITRFLAGFAVDEFPEPIFEDDVMTEHMRVFTPSPLHVLPPKKPPRKKRKG